MTPMEFHPWLLPGGFVMALSVIGGACIQDYRSSTPEAYQTVILDKQYQPEYYTEECDKKRCSTTYHPPTWWLKYADPGQNSTWAQVTSGTYETFLIGHSCWVRYWKGGYFGVRYSTVFSYTQPEGER